MLTEPIRYLCQCSPAVFLMDLGNFPCHRTLPVRTEELGKLLQSLDKTIRGLVKNH